MLQAHSIAISIETDKFLRKETFLAIYLLGKEFPPLLTVMPILGNL
jgi:hypothetical protein